MKSEFLTHAAGKPAQQPGGESYAYYVALTDAILALSKRIRRDDPAQFLYDGLDLSHAFEASAYFACVHDRGLQILHANPRNFPAALRLKSQIARLLAAETFAGGPAAGAARWMRRLHHIARGAKHVAQRRTEKSARPHAPAAMQAPIIFFARSIRFARYFLPLAHTLRGECAFLVPAWEGALRRQVAEWDFPVLFYHAGGVPRGAMGRLIDDCGRHLASQAQALDAALGGMQGRLVVVPEGNSPEDEILARVAERRGIASACIQQGWSPIRHPGFCNLNYSEMLVWGDGFADLLAAANPRQRFASTGNFHLAADMPASGTDILFLFQGFDDWLGGRAGAEAMLTLVERTAAALPEISVFVRPHPVAPFCAEVSNRLLRNPNVRIETPADVPLAQALAKVRVSVSAYSTTILESIAAGVVPVIFNTVGLPHYWPDVAAANAGIEVRELEAAQAALVQLLRKQGALEAFREPMAAMASRFFSARGSAARDATVSALRRLAKGP